jgi:hypothetical protein
MRRNTITIIELIIILCVIVVAVRVWGFKYSNDNNRCPRCWSSDIYESGIYNDCIGEVEHTCRKCKWRGVINPLTKKEREDILKAGGAYEKELDK